MRLLWPDALPSGWETFRYTEESELSAPNRLVPGVFAANGIVGSLLALARALSCSDRHGRGHRSFFHPKERTNFFLIYALIGSEIDQGGTMREWTRVSFRCLGRWDNL